MITTLADLSPATRAAAQAWLDVACAGMDADLADALRDELVGALCAQLDADATPADVAALAAALGPIGADVPGDHPDRDPRIGTFAGIPFDWRPPSGDRIKRNLWDPSSDRLWNPRAFGAGWDLNFGALAVRLGIIEPDAEDDPFTQTPDAAFAAAAALPIALAGAVALHYFARGSALPDRLPAHWNLAGRTDRWTTKGAAASQDVLVTTAAAVVSAAAAGRRGSRPSRAGVQALTAVFATLGAGLTVLRSAPDQPRWWAGPLLAKLSLGAAGATLVGLALAGRAAEQRRDLGGTR